MSSLTPKLPSPEASKSRSIGGAEGDSSGEGAAGGARVRNGSASGDSNGVPLLAEATSSDKNQPSPKQPQQPQQPLGSQPSAVLESKLRTLQSKSNELSQALTQRLAASESGQNLLHIGSSLSTLPPDLQSLLASLRPLLKDTESFETAVREDLARVVRAGTEIRLAQRRVDDAMDCSDMYRDLLSAERDVRRDAELRGVSAPTQAADDHDGDDDDDDDDDDDEFEELDHVASLERAAHTTLHLTQQLKISTAEISAMTTPRGPGSHDATGGGPQSSTSSSPLPSLRAPLPDDTERAQFLMKLAPRIRRLEDDTVKSLISRLEAVLTQLKDKRSATTDADAPDLDIDADTEGQTSESNPTSRPMSSKEASFIDPSEVEELENDLLKVGHCVRGLALLGRGSEAESAFARVAIMPLIRTRLSMGRLDQGGSRGECAGLFSLLDDLSSAISNAYGPVLQMSEGIFGISTIGEAADASVQKASVEVDLLTAGVWIPIATALLADPAIKMAIFSPGIASILQANYTAIDNFLSRLGERMLKPADIESNNVCDSIDAETSERKSGGVEKLYFKPLMSDSMIRWAQSRIYQHEKTADFMKKWNLPIYYQLRFGECCARLDTALSRVQSEGWSAAVFTGPAADAERLRNSPGLELPFFMELYDILSWLWRSDVFLQPLTHRFVRGAVQLLGRSISFVRDGLEGKISFGGKESAQATGEDGGRALAPSLGGTYRWGDRVEDVAAVAWELTVLEMAVGDDYVNDVVTAASSGREFAMDSNRDELRAVISSTLTEISREFAPIITKSWNDIIVNVLTKRCCAPLSAVKGVAATYRMTNRPPPTQPSPFVATVLRSLKEFDSNFSSRTPPQIGFGWKREIVRSVADVYSSAVDELLATVQRTEVALKNRKARRAAAGGMSDGEKVKLQLYLDQVEFARHVEDVGIDGSGIEGLVKLAELTSEAKSLQQQLRNGTPSIR